jgi:opacity protein-like surface antigen
MIKQVAIVVGVLCVLTSTALSQDGPWDLSVSGAGVLSKQTRGNGIVQAPTQGSGIVASLARRLGSSAALQLNFGHNLNSQKYVSGGVDYRIKSTITEFSGALVFRVLQREKLKPFVLGGGGALIFNPDSTLIDQTAQNIGAQRQTRPAVLYGAGVDCHLFSRLSLRLQYRGLFYSPPNYHVPNLFTGGRGHMAEPSVGLVFNF